MNETAVSVYKHFCYFFQYAKTENG
jgi:hypothetical protein